MRRSAEATARDEILDLLRLSFAEMQARNSRFSLRSFAKKVRLQPSMVSEVFNGKRQLTLSLAARVLESLAVHPKEAQELLNRMRKNSVKKSPQGSKSRRGSPPTLLKYIQISGDEFNLVSDWFYFAILSLAETTGFKSSPAWIARRLGIRTADAKKALGTLTRLKLLKRDESGRLCATGTQFATTTDVPSVSIRKNHGQGLDLAKDALEDVPLERREFGAITMAIDPSLLPEAKKRIREFRRELEVFLKNGEKAEVYRMGMQFFPLTKEIKK